MTGLKSPLLSLSGAVPAEGADEGVAAHYGDIFREQRSLAQGSGFVDLSHRGVLTVTGDDRLSWLHLLLTQHVSALPSGQATEALVLSPNGHVEHALYLVDDGTTTWAHVEPGTQQALIGYLESMKFFYRVEVADATGDFAVVHLPHGFDRIGRGRGRRPRADVRAGPLPAARRTRRTDLGLRPGGKRLGVRGAADRGPPAAARLRDRPPDHPARGGLAGDRRAPAEGLLPGAGDGGPGAQPGAAAAAGWSSCTWTAPRRCCPRTGRRCGSPRTRRGARSAS